MQTYHVHAGDCGDRIDNDSLTMTDPDEKFLALVLLSD
jgi:hypothetical protein